MPGMRILTNSEKTRIARGGNDNLIIRGNGVFIGQPSIGLSYLRLSRRV